MEGINIFYGHSLGQVGKYSLYGANVPRFSLGRYGKRHANTTFKVWIMINRWENKLKRVILNLSIDSTGKYCFMLKIEKYTVKLWMNSFGKFWRKILNLTGKTVGCHFPKHFIRKAKNRKLIGCVNVFLYIFFMR